MAADIVCVSHRSQLRQQIHGPTAIVQVQALAAHAQATVSHDADASALVHLCPFRSCLRCSLAYMTYARLVATRLVLHLSLLNMLMPVSRSPCAALLQVDFLMSGLIVLKERVDATEALIAIDLDNRRNDLVAFDLV